MISELLRDALLREAAAELHVAIVQMIDTDDQIICGHVRKAETLLSVARKHDDAAPDMLEALQGLIEDSDELLLSEFHGDRHYCRVCGESEELHKEIKHCADCSVGKAIMAIDKAEGKDHESG